jgi:hypothetical protein
MSMKKNRPWILIALILVIIAGTLTVTRSKTTLRKSVSDFSVKDTASITRIFLADMNGNEITLNRKAGSWLVNGEKPAQQAKVNSFLKTLADLEVRSPVPVKARDNVIRRMSAISRKVEIYQEVPRLNLLNLIRLFPHEKNTKTYYVGDVTQDNLGTFMLMEGADEPFVVHIPNFRGFVSTRYSPLPEDWRDYTVFRAPLEMIASVKIEFPTAPEESYSLEVKHDNSIAMTSLTSGIPVEAYDTIRVLNFLTSFDDIRFEALLNTRLEPSFIDSVRNSVPQTVITLKKKDNRSDIVRIYSKKGFSYLYQADGAALEPMDLDRAYALVNNGEDFVLIQYFIFDKITRPLSYLLGK